MDIFWCVCGSEQLYPAWHQHIVRAPAGCPSVASSEYKWFAGAALVPLLRVEDKSDITFWHPRKYLTTIKTKNLSDQGLNKINAIYYLHEQNKLYILYREKKELNKKNLEWFLHIQLQKHCFAFSSLFPIILHAPSPTVTLHFQHIKQVLSPRPC